MGFKLGDYQKRMQEVGFQNKMHLQMTEPD